MFEVIYEVIFTNTSLKSIIFLVIAFNIFIFLCRVASPLPTLDNKPSLLDSKPKESWRSNKVQVKLANRFLNNRNVKTGSFRPRLYGVKPLNFVRYKSNSATSLSKSKTCRPISLTPKQICNPISNETKNSEAIKSEVINSVLLNQKVAISQKELDQLLSLPGVKFDLPITSETEASLLALIRKPHSKRSKTGVYIFTHISTGNKYVGSSNDLARRFKQYFDKNLLFANKNHGLLMPLIHKEGIEAFSLQVIVVPSSYPKYSYCFLEQYFLLDQSFNLNTQRVVNFRVNQGLKVFLYDKECKILYHSSNSLNAFCADLSIHSSSYRKCISTGVPYLNLFVISNTLIEDAVPANLTESEVFELLAKSKKESLNKRSLDLGKEIVVFDKETNETNTYSSVYKVAARLGTTRATIRNNISSGKAFKNRYHLSFAESNK